MTSQSADQRDVFDNDNCTDVAAKSDGDAFLHRVDNRAVIAQTSPTQKGSAHTTKRQKGPWYNFIGASYKSRSVEFSHLFKLLPKGERLLADYTCAVQRDILVHGRMYISQNYLSFHANIFGWQTFLTLKLNDVKTLTKEKTAYVIPNAIQLTLESTGEKYFFASFASRDKTFLTIFRLWQSALANQVMTTAAQKQFINTIYGDVSSDDDTLCDVTSQSREHLMAPVPAGAFGIGGSLTKLFQFVGGTRNVAMESDSPEKERGTDHICFTDSTLTNGSSTPSAPSGESPLSLNSCSTASSSILSPYAHVRKYSCPNPTTEGSKPKAAETDLFLSHSNGSAFGREAVAQPPSPLRIASDSSESATEEDEAVQCCCECHTGKVTVDTVYPVFVDQLFALLFTESKFYSDFQAKRKTTDVTHADWQVLPDSGDETRQVTYTLSLGLFLGPKTSFTTEIQILFTNMCDKSRRYTVDVEATNSDIPFADSFYTYHRYCLTRVTAQKCKLVVHSEIRYRRPVLGLMKSVLEKSAVQGMEDYFKELEAALSVECEAMNCIAIGNKSGRVVRRRRKNPKTEMTSASEVLSVSKSGSLKKLCSQSSHSLSGKNAPVIRVSKQDSPMFVKFILIILLCLLVVNAILYRKLWELEEQALRIISPQVLFSTSRDPISEEEISVLIKKQHAMHQGQITHWKNLLQTASIHIQQTEKVLGQLQLDLDVYAEAFVNGVHNIGHYRQRVQSADRVVKATNNIPGG